MLQATEYGQGLRDSKRRDNEEDLWLYGRFLVEPLHRILQDAALRKWHGPASFALSVAAYQPLNEEYLDSIPPQQARYLLARNDAARQVVIEHRNTQEGFVTDDPAYDEKQEQIARFWQTYGEDFTYDSGARWGAVLTETGFVTFFGKLFTGQLYSQERDRYVFSLIGERWYVSFWLQFLAIAIAWSISLPLGIRSARRRGTLEDRTTTTGLFLLWSLPDFFVGSLFLYYLCTDTATGEALFPNRGVPDEDAVWMSTPRFILDLLHHGFLPLVCLTYASFTVLSRYMRGNMLDQLSSDYVRTARAKGVGDDAVVYGHVLPNGLITMITIGSGLFASLFGGFVVVEYIFRINGLGLLLLEAAMARDAPLVMGATVISVALLLFGILLADILYAVVDPRIRSRYA